MDKSGNPIDEEMIQIESMSAIDLIEILDSAYPERCLSPMDTIESGHRYAGRRELINELVYIKDYIRGTVPQD